MTNIEKWKQELTIDGFVQIMDGIDCEICPVSEQCREDGYVEESCREAVRKWAKKEANNAR